MFLVTTPLTKPLSKDERVVYLGNWCLPDTDNRELNDLNHSIIPHPLENLSAKNNAIKMQQYIQKSKSPCIVASYHLILNEENEVLQIKFEDKIYSLNKIILKMKISKLDLADNSLCK